MKRLLRPLALSLLAVFIAAISAPTAYAQLSQDAAPVYAWRWWDDVVAWVRSISWDRGRMVQVWLLFVLAGLYVIVRTKPRA